MSKSIKQASSDTQVQRAYSVAVPNMDKCRSTDEFSMMVLQALEAVSLYQECKEKTRQGLMLSIL